MTESEDTPEARIAHAAYELVKGLTALELSALLTHIETPPGSERFGSGKGARIVRAIVRGALTIREADEETAILERARLFRETGALTHFLEAATLFSNTTPAVRSRLAELERLEAAAARSATAHLN